MKDQEQESQAAEPYRGPSPEMQAALGRAMQCFFGDPKFRQEVGMTEENAEELIAGQWEKAIEAQRRHEGQRWTVAVSTRRDPATVRAPKRRRRSSHRSRKFRGAARRASARSGDSGDDSSGSDGPGDAGHVDKPAIRLGRLVLELDRAIDEIPGCGDVWTIANATRHVEIALERLQTAVAR